MRIVKIVKGLLIVLAVVIAASILYSALRPILTVAETLVCIYRPSLVAGTTGPSTIEIKINGKTADVHWITHWVGESPFPANYNVLENTEHGLVISHTYAAPEDKGMTPTIGGYAFVIDRKTGAMKYGSLFLDSPEHESTKGNCLFRK